MNKKYNLVVVDWLDIETRQNENRDVSTGGVLNRTAGFMYKKYKIHGKEHIRVITSAVVLKPSEISETDDFIDIPVGCIKKIRKYGKYDLGVSIDKNKLRKI